MLFEWNAERLDLLKYTVWTLKNAKWKSVLGREALVQKLSRIFGQCPNNFWTPTPSNPRCQWVLSFFEPFHIICSLIVNSTFVICIVQYLKNVSECENFCHYPSSKYCFSAYYDLLKTYIVSTTNVVLFENQHACHFGESMNLAKNHKNHETTLKNH